MQNNNNEMQRQIACNHVCDTNGCKEYVEVLKRYEAIFQNASDIILFFDLNGRIIDGNKAAIKAYGYTYEELVNLTIYHIRTDSILTEKQLQRAYRNGMNFETIHTRKDGSWFYAEVHSQGFEMGEQQVIISIIRDISERKNTEKALSESRAKYYSLFMNMESGFAYNRIILDAQGQACDYEYIEVNETFAKIVGKPRQEIIGRKFSELYPDVMEIHHKRIAIFGDVALHGKQSYIQDEYVQAFKAWYSTSVYSTEKGYFAVILYDITERKKSEDRVLQAMKDAETASKAKSEFLANMSHEIRTPLNGMLGMLELTLMTELNGEQKEYLLTSKYCANSLQHIINDILDFSKLEAGKLAIQKNSFDIKDMIFDIIKIHAVNAAKKGLELNYLLSSSLPPYLIGDSLRIQQILNNLISNAIKFTDAGEIQLSVKTGISNEDFVELLFMVSDTGMGIDEKDVPKLFNSFSQLETTVNKKHKGTGLGLVISKQLVELMGGRIWFESKKNRGSCFSFAIILEKGEAPSKKDRYMEASGMEFNQPLNILLAEDDAVNQKVLTQLLKKKGHRVALAANGQEVYDYYIKNKYDIILMDIQMPEVDGIEATAMIRQNEAVTQQHIPIIALTAFALQGDRERFLKMGIDEYVSKPVKISELYDKIAVLCGSKSLPKNWADAEINKGGELPSNDGIKDTIVKIEAGLDKLKLAILQQDIKEIEQLAHHIKMASGSIEAYDLKNSAFRIELAARRGNAADIEEYSRQLIREYETLWKSI